MIDIKFRAWLKNEHKMVDVDSIDFTNKRITYYDKDFEFECFGALSFDEIELMQYTGLKDDNGTEIYEGDIVESIYDYYSCSYKEITTVGKVVIEAGMVWTQDKNGEILTYLSEIDTTLDCEVLGNAYENAELLEV